MAARRGTAQRGAARRGRSPVPHHHPDTRAGKPYHTPARLLLTLPSTEQTRAFAQQVAPYLKPAALAHPKHCRDFALYAGSVPHA